MNNKIKIIIIAIITFLLALIITFFIYSSKNNNEEEYDIIRNGLNSANASSSKKKKTYKETESAKVDVGKPIIVEEKEQKTTSKTIQKKLTVNKLEFTNIKYTYDGFKYYLSFTIKNTSNETADLSKYNMYLLDKNSNTIISVDGKSLGKFRAQETDNSVIEFIDNISSIAKIEFKEKTK